MPLPATDDFNRDNGPLGANWTGSIGNDLAIASQECSGGGVALASMYWSADAPDAAQYAQCEFSAVAGAQYSGVFCRGSATDWVALITYGVTEWQINWYNGGAWTQIGATYGTAPTNNDIGKITADGTTFKGYINGTERISGSNESAPGSGYGGLYTEGQDLRLDDFEVGNLGAVTPAISVSESLGLSDSLTAHVVGPDLSIAVTPDNAAYYKVGPVIVGS